MAAPRTGSLGVATTVGDLYVVDANGDLERVPVGVDGQVLVADSTAVGPSGPIIGVTWKNPDFVAKASFQADAVDAVFKTIDIGGVIALPASATRGSHAVLSFAQAVVRGIPWQKYMPTDYSGGDLRVTISWAPSTAAAGDVLWGVAFERDNDGLDIDVDNFAAVVPFAVSPAPGVAGEIQEAVLVVTNAQADGIVTGEPLRLFIQRNAADVSDTLGANALLVRVVVEEV